MDRDICCDILAPSTEHLLNKESPEHHLCLLLLCSLKVNHCNKKLYKQFAGHDGEIYCGKFAKDGKTFVSAGHDRHIFYWDVFGECLNYHQIPNAHKVGLKT